VFLPVCLYSKYLWVGSMVLTYKAPIYSCLSNRTLSFLSTVSLLLRYGQPVVSIPLPSTMQVCDISIKPLTETVEDFLANIKAEDGGITSAAVYSKDGNRMSLTTAMHHVLLSDFDIDINGIRYDIKIPDNCKTNDVCCVCVCMHLHV